MVSLGPECGGFGLGMGEAWACNEVVLPLEYGKSGFEMRWSMVRNVVALGLGLGKSEFGMW